LKKTKPTRKKERKKERKREREREREKERKEGRKKLVLSLFAMTVGESILFSWYNFI
jgi:cytoskeletal protein RodZ